MSEEQNTREELLDELHRLRQRVAELEATEGTPHMPEKSPGARETEERHRVIVQKAQEGILVAQDGMHRFVNPAAARIYEYSEEELLSRPFAEFLHPEDRDMVLDRSLRRARGEDIPGRYGYRILTKEGKTKWVEIDSAAISWEGKPAVLVFATDITEHRQIEEALKEREKHYQTLVEQSFDGVMITKGPRIVFVNSRLCEMLGYSRDELEGMDHWRTAHPDYQDLVLERGLARMKGEDVPSFYEAKVLRKDGSVFDAEVSARAIEVQGEPGLQVWMRDITERKKVEEALKKSEALYRAAFNNAAVGIIMTDRQGTLLNLNSAALTMLDYTRQELKSLSFSEITHPDDVELSRKEFKTLVEGETDSYRIEKRYLRKDGEPVWVDLSVARILDEKGDCAATFGLAVDITNKKRAEQERESLRGQLLQAQKMEAIGTLADGIAHDFNNMLTIILGYAEMLLLDTDETDPGYDDLQKILQTARNGAELVQGLLLFSRKAEMKPVALDLNREIRRVKNLLSRALPKIIEIELHLAHDLPIIDADPTQIDQVLMNLALNSSEAMHESGKLAVETRTVCFDEDDWLIHHWLKPGYYVLLTVSDNGRGMDRQTLERVFDPFFTTKERDFQKGTGLGLSIVQGVVEQHGGRITCESQMGKGTTFKIYLPAAASEKQNASEKESRVAQEVPPPGSKGMILLVDAEELVRDLGVRILEKAGYKVILARNGKKALELYKNSQDAISLVILDLIMPEMGGKECLEKLLQMDPTARVLVTSGFSPDTSTKKAIQAGAKGFVGKPYNAKQLTQAVQNALSAN